MDHFPKIRRPFLDTSPLSSPLVHESESGSSESSGSETPSPPARPPARFPSVTPPLERNGNGSSERSQNVERDNNKGWYEFDLSVIVALVSPIGNWLTGGDYIKNLLLILLLIFYLHQIIEGMCFAFIIQARNVIERSTMEPLSSFETQSSFS
jgi:hypothetical protein